MSLPAPGAGDGRSGIDREHFDAWRIASVAGAELKGLRRLLDQDWEPDKLRMRADRRANEVILGELAAAYPDDPVLSEEARDDLARTSSRRVWVVDPLDGTREFGEPGRGDWAVHVALVVDRVPVVGAVALPARGLTLATRPVWRPPSTRNRRPRIAVSRTRPPQIALAVAKRLGAVLVEMGSAGNKAMSVLLGETDIYLHAGGQFEWDSAAPVAVAIAAGLHASRIDGSELLYNNPEPWLPDLVICRREMADRVLEAIRDAPEEAAATTSVPAASPALAGVVDGCEGGWEP